MTANLRNKAVLVDFEGIPGINAQTTVERWDYLGALETHLNNYLAQRQWNAEEHIFQYQLLIRVKATQNWLTQWGGIEDAHLLLGVHFYGFGSWEKVRDVSIPYQTMLVKTILTVFP